MRLRVNRETLENEGLSGGRKWGAWGWENFQAMAGFGAWVEISKRSFRKS
jgi:hypothetical protein